MISDGYAQWYANRLWQLLPAIYRSLDVGPTPGSKGPLRELINRIGSQAAVVRRNVDRLGENQSIETCDDWAIPYIGDLVATRLVSCLDAAAQRIDVAKTIYYRRRAGTVGVLEELAADIASRDARVVEFFRRMGRTRHQFDPPLSYQIENDLTGPVGFTGTSLEVEEGLIGAYSNTPAEDLPISAIATQPATPAAPLTNISTPPICVPPARLSATSTFATWEYSSGGCGPFPSRRPPRSAVLEPDRRASPSIPPAVTFLSSRNRSASTTLTSGESTGFLPMSGYSPSRSAKRFGTPFRTNSIRLGSPPRHFPSA